MNWRGRGTSRGKRATDRRPRGRFEPLEDRCLLSITPELIKDINTTEAGSWPQWLTEMGSDVYFTAFNQAAGVELHRSDGTGEGTLVVKDIVAGPNSSAPADLTRVGARLYFTADDSIHGQELWLTDGTEQGTRLVKDITPGWAGTFFGEFAAVGNTLFFVAQDADGSELWRSDGTADGTHKVKDICLGPDSSSPSELLDFQGQLFFTADDRDHGREIWQSDGTAEGTQMLADLVPGPSSLPPGSADASRLFTVVGDTLYFAINDGDHAALWNYTSAGGPQLSYHVSPKAMADGGGILLVVGGATGTENTLWSYDGDTLIELGDFSPGSPSEFVAYKGVTYFTSRSQSGYSLWRTDATPAGTTLVKSFEFGEYGGAAYLASAAGFLYFSAATATGPWDPRHLWKSDGTTAGTIQVKEYEGRGVTGLCVTVGDAALFVADDGLHGYELWRSDGTESGTQLVANLNASTAGSQTLAPSIAVGAYAYFEAIDEQGLNLWRTDGSPEGTLRLTGGDTQPRGHLQEPTDVAGHLMYFTYGPTGYMELWSSDGTPQGTRMVKRFPFGVAEDNYRALTAVGSSLYFLAYDSATGVELWRSDGTEAGTTIVKDIRPGKASPFGPYDVSLTVGPNGLIYFAADTSPLGRELWVSDGTADGTHMVREPASLGEELGPYDIVAWQDHVYFVSDAEGAPEIWVSDGTDAGTAPLVRVDDPNAPHQPRGFWPAGRYLLFAAEGSEGQPQLWATDGVGAGAGPLKDLVVVPIFMKNLRFANMEGWTYFVADDGAHGSELWRTNGTAGGTELVRDITPGPSSSSIEGLTALNGTLFFLADSPQGTQLWRSDGTAGGTQPFDLLPLTRFFQAVGRTVVISAHDSVVGNELFSLTPPPGDTNYDGLVDLTDFGRLKATFGAAGESLAADFDVNGVVDLGDFGLLKENFGRPGSVSGDAWVAKAEPTAAGPSAVAPPATTSEASPAGLPRNEWIEAVAYQLAWTLLAREQLPASID